MTEELEYITFNTDMGWIGISASVRGLRHLTLPQCSVQEANQLLGNSLSRTTPAPHSFEDLIRRLRLYFNGHRVAFPDRLDLSGATTFQRQVWETTRLIPYGETRSYRWVAGQTGKPLATRATGQALGSNPLPIIIPCHRVIASDGKLGGFTGGVEIKQRLLAIEAASSIR